MSEHYIYCNHQSCGREFPAHESMPDPETKRGDYCFECYVDMEYEWDVKRGTEWLQINLPDMNTFMQGYKKFAKGSLDPEKMANNCHAAAHTLVQLVKGKMDIKLQRGHWTGGDVRKDNKRTVAQHSWTKVKVPDNNVMFIVDPTQWVFTGQEPYLCIVSEDDGRYDVGGYGIKSALLGEKVFPKRAGKLMASTLSDEAYQWLKSRNKRDWTKWTLDEMFVIANMDPRSMCGNQKEIFNAIIKSGNKGLIPLEGLALALGEM